MYLLELAGEDDAYAAAEAGCAAADVDVVGPGLATAASVDADRVAGLAYTRRASRLVGRTRPSVSAACDLLEAADVDRAGSVAVRARDVRGTAGVDTRAAERALGDVLVARGFAVDLESPDHELRALFADGVGALGWLAVEGDRGFGDRRPTDRPFFQPGSMDPLEARAVANLAGARPGATVLDPMCGTGGLLLEAGLVGARVVGFDAQRTMARGSRENLGRYLDGGFDVGRCDAARLPVADGAVDAVVFDAPYGRQSLVEGEGAGALLRAALGEARRVADRAVVVADAEARSAAEEAGWTVEAVFARRVHRSLTRHVHVLR